MVALEAPSDDRLKLIVVLAVELEEDRNVLLSLLCLSQAQESEAVVHALQVERILNVFLSLGWSQEVARVLHGFGFFLRHVQILYSEQLWKIIQGLVVLVVLFLFVVENDLVDQVRIHSAKGSNKPEDELSNFGNLLRLNQIANDGQNFRIEKVGFDDEASVLNHGNEGSQGHLSLLEVALVLHTLEDEGENLRNVGLCSIRINDANLFHHVEQRRNKRRCDLLLLVLVDPLEETVEDGLSVRLRELSVILNEGFDQLGGLLSLFVLVTVL